MQNKERNRLAREKEAAFLVAFYRKTSVTRLDRRASAIAAGYPVARAVWSANRVLEKYADTSFRECAEMVGISKARMAVMLSEIMEHGEPKEKLSSVRLMLANIGEATDNRDARGMTFQGPTMVIVGATPERIQALKGCSAPEFTEYRAAELPPAAEEDVIEVAAAPTVPESAPEPVQPKPFTSVVEDARRLTAADFAGRKRGDVGSR